MRKSDGSLVTILLLVTVITVLGVIFGLKKMGMTVGKGNGGDGSSTMQQSGTQTGEKKEATDVQIFNSTILSNIGQKRRTAKTVINEVTKSNSTYTNKQIVIEYGGKTYSDDFTELTNQISATDQYDIKVEFDNDGYINKVIISK